MRIEFIKFFSLYKDGCLQNSEAESNDLAAVCFDRDCDLRFLRNESLRLEDVDRAPHQHFHA